MWKFASCEVQGRGHIKNNVPCQDKTFLLEENGVCVIALSDGAGSARLSHFGAAAVTQMICKKLVQQFDDFFQSTDALNVKNDILESCEKTLKDEANKQQAEIDDLSCTLLFAAIKENKFLLGHVGDGVIGYIKDDKIAVASVPYNGEFSNETVFVNSKLAVATMKLLKGEMGSIKSFILMSDGTETSLYSKKQNFIANGALKMVAYTSAYEKNYATKILENILSKQISMRTSDDCSIAIVVKGKFQDMSNKFRAALYGIGADDEDELKKYDLVVNDLLNGKKARKRKIFSQVGINSHKHKKILKELEDNLVVEKMFNRQYCCKIEK